MKRINDAILQILMGVLLAVMAAQTYMAGPNVSSPMLIGMASVAVAVAVRELVGRRLEARAVQRDGDAPAEPPGNADEDVGYSPGGRGRARPPVEPGFQSRFILT